MERGFTKQLDFSHFARSRRQSLRAVSRRCRAPRARPNGCRSRALRRPRSRGRQLDESIALDRDGEFEITHGRSADRNASSGARPVHFDLGNLRRADRSRRGDSRAACFTAVASASSRAQETNGAHSESAIQNARVSSSASEDDRDRWTHSLFGQREFHRRGPRRKRRWPPQFRGRHSDRRRHNARHRTSTIRSHLARCRMRVVQNAIGLRETHRSSTLKR